VIVLDEPFSALDQSNSRALAGHVNQLVSDGFAQSFVIAHTRQVLESLPGRIEVTGSGEWSSVRVVA
jgi:DNA repair exonuclease SbcCD ATPase subunit